MPRPVPGLETATDPTFWLGKFQKLVVDKRPERRANVAERFGTEAAQDDSCEFATYKPLLMFGVLAGFEEGQHADGVVHRDAELTFRYESLFALVVECCGNAPDVRMPFHALCNDQVWAVYTKLLGKCCV